MCQKKAWTHLELEGRSVKNRTPNTSAETAACEKTAHGDGKSATKHKIIHILCIYLYIGEERKEKNSHAYVDTGDSSGALMVHGVLNVLHKWNLRRKKEIKAVKTLDGRQHSLRKHAVQFVWLLSGAWII